MHTKISRKSTRLVVSMPQRNNLMVAKVYRESIHIKLTVILKWPRSTQKPERKTTQKLSKMSDNSSRCYSISHLKRTLALCSHENIMRRPKSYMTSLSYIPMSQLIIKQGLTKLGKITNIKFQHSKVVERALKQEFLPDLLLCQKMSKCQNNNNI